MVNTATDELKIIDFGSAVSVMTKNNRHLSYIVSRYYRAPELLFASEVYNEKIVRHCLYGMLALVVHFVTRR
jgi:serine/threonine protein kinase